MTQPIADSRRPAASHSHSPRVETPTSVIKPQSFEKETLAQTPQIPCFSQTNAVCIPPGNTACVSPDHRPTNGTQPPPCRCPYVLLAHPQLQASAPRLPRHCHSEDGDRRKTERFPCVSPCKGRKGRCVADVVDLGAVGQAVGQICSTSSMAHNLDQCVELVRKAADAGAKVRFRPCIVLSCHVLGSWRVWSCVGRRRGAFLKAVDDMGGR